MKKILSLVLVAAMLASMLVFVPAAGAAELPVVAAGVAAATPGAEVKVPVTITFDQNLAGFSVLCEYDGERLEFVKADTAPVNAASSKDGYTVESNGDAVFDEWYKKGCFASFSWAAAVSGGEEIATEGLVVAYLVFKVKENAPAGDAYVAIRNYGAMNASGNTICGTLVAEDASNPVQGENITCVDGKVTVLPEGWVDVTPSAEDDFVIADGVLTAYNGSDDVVVIPSTVTKIAKVAFMDSSVKKVVIPASVELIEKGAFLNCMEMTEVYILGAETVLEESAMGFEGTYNKKKGVTITGCLYADEECLYTLLNITSVPNPGVAEYAETGDGFEDEATKFGYTSVDGFTVTVGSAAFFAPKITTAPGVMRIDGKVAVAYTVGGKTVAAGQQIDFTADTTLTPVLVNAPETLPQVGFKAANFAKDLAFRFTSTLAEADVAALMGLGEVKFGMLITPAKYVSLAGALTKTALDSIGAKNGAYVDVKLGGYFTYDTDAKVYTFAGAIKNFSEKTLAANPAFASVMYVTVTINGVDVTIYGDYNWEGVHDIKGTTETIIKTAPVTDGSVVALRELLKKFK